MSNAAVLYKKLIAQNNPLPPELERAVMRLVTAKEKINDTDSVDILQTLAHRKNLLPETAERIAKIPNASIKSIWLSRPELSREELINFLKGEKRSTVIAAVAASDEASAELLDVLSLNETRPSVLTAILYNNKASQETLVRVIKAMSRSDRAMKDYNVTARIKSLFEQLLVNHADEFVSGVADETLASWALRKASKPESFAYFADTYLIPRLNSRQVSGSSFYVVQQDAALAVTIFNAAPADRSTKERLAVALHPHVAAAIAVRNAYGMPQELPELVELFGASPEGRKAAEKRIVERDRLLKDSSTPSTSTERLEEIYENEMMKAAAAVGNAHMRHIANNIALMNLLFNPSTPYHILDKLSAIVPTEVFHRFVTARIPVVKTEEDHLILVRALLRGAISPQGDWIKEVPNPGLVFSTLIAQLDSDLNNPWAMNAYYCITSMDSKIPQDYLNAIPWDYISDNPPAWFTERLVEALGDSTSAWGTFEVLSQEFQGTVGDLLETAKLLA